MQPAHRDVGGLIHGLENLFLQKSTRCAVGNRIQPIPSGATNEAFWTRDVISVHVVLGVHHQLLSQSRFRCSSVDSIRQKQFDHGCFSGTILQLSGGITEAQPGDGRRVLTGQSWMTDRAGGPRCGFRRKCGQLQSIKQPDQISP